MAAEQGDITASANGAGARRDAAPFPKRFYTQATIEPGGEGFALLLDGRPARTPGRQPLAFPTRPLAEAIAREWNGVGDVIDPQAMPMTRLANTVIDGVSRMQDDVLAEVVRFTGSDLILYRAAEPADLVRAQRKAWDGVVAWSRNELQAPLVLAEGIVFVRQPEASLAALAMSIRGFVGAGPGAPYRLAALHVMTTLTGSALLAIAVAASHLSAEDAWSAAHVDEDHQIAAWGEDAEAVDRRAARWREMKAASDLYRLAAG